MSDWLDAKIRDGALVRPTQAPHLDRGRMQRSQHSTPHRPPLQVTFISPP
jgi:hypothetical protein